ncbi:AraC family transcriptional regulator [Vagococcus elongatus]
MKRELAFNNKQIAHHQIEKEDLDRQLNQYKLNNLIQGKKHFHVSKENKLIDSVATGDMLQVEKQYAIFNQANHHVGVLSHGSRLRHEKNLCISVVAVTTRIAIANGVYYETAYDLSDWWIRKIEESNSCDEIIETELFLRILLSFAEQISSCQRKGLSDFVIQVQDYIVSTLYEGISLGEIAAFFNYNPNYLSKKFKKETGLPIKQYMLKEKIKESDNLIKYTDYSLLDIATMLHFSDYSHYYRCYKKIKGESPKNYEKKVR